MSNKSYSSKFKYEVIKDYQNENYTLKELCSRYQISKYTLYKWIQKFEKEGIRGLKKLKNMEKVF